MDPKAKLALSKDVKFDEKIMLHPRKESLVPPGKKNSVNKQVEIKKFIKKQGSYSTSAASGRCR